MIVSLVTTCLNLNTPPLAQVATFRCEIRESNAEVTLDTKLIKHACQLILVCTTLRFHAWSTASWPFRCVEGITMARAQSQPGPDKVSALSSSRVMRLWLDSKKLFANSLLGDRQFTKISYCLLLLLCSCFAPCPCSSLLLFAPCFVPCWHGPFIVRRASNLSTVPWFHFVCVSVSMFTITWQLSVSVSVPVSVSG